MLVVEDTGAVDSPGLPGTRRVRAVLWPATGKVVEPSISGNVDHLRGLKENVTMGRLIPAGTGFEYYRNVRIPVDEPPPPPALPQPTDEELDLERDMEYFVEPEEALGARGETLE